LDEVGLSSVATKRTGKFSLGMGQRLGIASALLGDPGILLFDEPVNGLDPEGIRWVRNLTRGLAADGRTVLVSSHLISEMALTADQLIVIGRGRLITEMSVAEFNARSPEAVRVRTPETERLIGRLGDAGIVAAPQLDGSLLVTGHRADVIADLAMTEGIPIYELSPERGSLEDVFMDLTRDGVEFRAGEPAPAQAGAPSPQDVPALSTRSR
jgi:ABC-2 type transport system ATP-binding protein